MFYRIYHMSNHVLSRPISGGLKFQRMWRSDKCDEEKVEKGQKMMWKSNKCTGSAKAKSTEMEKKFNSEPYILVLKSILDSNELKLLKLSTLKGYAYSKYLLQTHVMENPQLKAYLKDLKSKLDNVGKK